MNPKDLNERERFVMNDFAQDQASYIVSIDIMSVHALLHGCLLK